jgi:hypothetical protein
MGEDFTIFSAEERNLRPSFTAFIAFFAVARSTSNHSFPLVPFGFI